MVIKMQIYALFVHPKNVCLLLLSVSFEPVAKLFIKFETYCSTRTK